jgi:NAD(P)-dependent dehydrogenase (short-subunit alcohol dehydrogenase family)
MKNLKGKVAFITGGASGIGLSLARACGAQGMRVMLADIDSSSLDESVSRLRDAQIDVEGVTCDVTSEHSLRAAAAVTIECFGKVHMLVNNAGVLVVGGVGENSLDTWRWALDVNVMGVVYGTEVFLPLIREHGEGGHILNTASVGGHVAYGGVLAYSTTKHAVVGYTEALAGQLKNEDIGVSALCPGFTNTRIAETGRFVGNEDRGAGKDSGFVEAVEAGMSPEVVAQFTLEQIQQGALYIFTHPGTRGEVADRWSAISKAFDATEASELINGDPDALRVAHKNDVDGLLRVDKGNGRQTPPRNN